ncbi:hypothetical protein KFK09_007505 [Dendrobium nobile]|uniref:Aminotransferase-like plant mobile domain-containing protein n=1 Tax=Dendrobium nobile TaxID=94219 RepID=A0A8T3BUA8_DENNO|nr:hypothetical protein KFK09_007505 [Dendrobium nobile]
MDVGKFPASVPPEPAPSMPAQKYPPEIPTVIACFPVVELCLPGTLSGSLNGIEGRKSPRHQPNTHLCRDVREKEEHLHVGRPQLHVLFPVQLDGLSVGIRWNEERLREVPVGNVMTYRDELDGLLESQVIWEPYTVEIRAQVPEICTSGQDTWLSRVPLISWKRVEWHLPDRVLRQFGYCPSTNIMPMDPSFVRVDGCGKSDTDWALYHQASIALWESRRAYIVTTEIPGFDYDYKVKQYLAWFHSWATLNMLKALVDPPSTYYPRSLAERHLLNYLSLQ